MTDVDVTTDERYDYWRRTLAGEQLPVHEASPQLGFYMRRTGDGTKEPLAIFETEGGVIAVAGFERRTVDLSGSLWIYASTHPISDTAYWEAIDAGNWPGDGPQAPRPIRSSVPGGNVAVAPNEAPDEDPRDRLAAQITAAANVLGELLKAGIKTPGDAEKLTNSKDRISALSKEADGIRKREKRPWDEGAAEVQTRWRGVLAAADVAYGAAVDALTDWQRAERRRAEAAAAEENRRREEAAAAAKAAGTPPPEDTAPVVAAKVRTGGTLSGKRTSLRTVRRWATIENYDKALAAFKDHALVVAAVQEAANAAARAQGPAIDGIKFEAEERAV